ncbi:MAG: tetratricopeptide repeat protein, partial [Candidatus Methanoperedens sp.]|nr:tetratricopeptide repeat protein [Candidatus Methanoperedens sp.]
DMGSFEELRQRINEFQPHIVHLTGHGIVKEDGLGYFAFEDERGNADLRSSLEIRQELFAGSSVQCAFISGCQSGKAPPVEALGGVCQGLVGEEVPLAIGWAASIADNISTQFAAAFYNTLAAGQPVDRALTQARLSIKKLCEEQGDPSWTLPVLYSATSQRLVFDPHMQPVTVLRKSVVQSPLPGMTEGYAKQFIGRRREMQEFLPALREGSLQTVLITGLGGTGKSTLATRLARKLEADGFVPIPVPGSRDNPLNAAILMQKCNDAFLAAGLHDAYSTLQDARIPVDSRLRYIITVLNKNRFLLVLDNFEANIDEITRKILDPELAGFYTHMMSNLSGESRAIVTSRYMPADVPVLPPIAREKPLGDFPESSFIKFMLLDGVVEQRYYKNEISYALLGRLYELLGGTPRFLGQIREVLKTIKAEELGSELDAVELPGKEKPAMLQQARDKYCEDIFTSRLFGYLKSDSQKALCRAAVYGIPVNLSGMKAVSYEPVEKLQRFTREWQDYALAYPEPSAGLWIIYGLLRSWLLAPERLSPDERRAAHRAAGDFLSELVKNDRTSELGMTPLDVALYAYSQYTLAEDYENAASITFELQEYLDTRGNYRTLVELYNGVLPGTHSAVLGNLGSAFYRLGQVEKAIQYYEKALAIDKEIGDRRGEGNALGNLGLAYDALGQVEKAIQYYEKTLPIDKEIGDRRGEGTTLGNLGNAFYSLGQIEKAIQYYEKALDIAQEIEDRKGEGNALGNLGIAYNRFGQVEKAIQYYERALAIAQEIGDRRGEGNALGNLGIAYSALGQIENAIQYYEKALAIVKKIGDRKGEGNTLGNLGNAYSALGQVKKAIQYYEKALAIAQEIGDRRGEGARLNNLGFVFQNEKKYRDALACYLLAKDIRTQIKDPELKRTESNLKNLMEKLGEKEFEKLIKEVDPEAEEIVRKLLA